MEVFNLAKDSPEAEELVRHVHARIAAIFDDDSADDSLARYVVVLLSGHRSRGQVEAEVNALLKEIMDDSEEVAAQLVAWCAVGGGARTRLCVRGAERDAGGAAREQGRPAGRWPLQHANATL